MRSRAHDRTVWTRRETSLDPVRKDAVSVVLAVGAYVADFVASASVIGMHRQSDVGTMGGCCFKRCSGGGGLRFLGADEMACGLQNLVEVVSEIRLDRHGLLDFLVDCRTLRHRFNWPAPIGGCRRGFLSLEVTSAARQRMDHGSFCGLCCGGSR